LPSIPMAISLSSSVRKRMVQGGGEEGLRLSLKDGRKSAAE
jgi:hypothetical protein